MSKDQTSQTPPTEGIPPDTERPECIPTKPGDVLLGVIVRTDVAWNRNGAYPFVTLDVLDMHGERTGERVTFALHGEGLEDIYGGWGMFPEWVMAIAQELDHQPEMGQGHMYYLWDHASEVAFEVPSQIVSLRVSIARYLHGERVSEGRASRGKG